MEIPCKQMIHSRIDRLKELGIEWNERENAFVGESFDKCWVEVMICPDAEFEKHLFAVQRIRNQKLIYESQKK
ncbi:MAG: hypothetical protein WC389_14960 [Lutibacter sp.]|jgi:hypothetical protein